MCGIAGLIAFRSSAPNPPTGVVEAMCATIEHRGPDDQGVYRGERAHIGMRRLAIIDLAGGNQPIASSDEKVQLVFNGEIYNYRELRKDLEKSGRIFRSDSDSEVVLQAYLEYGDDAFALLRGMFALAIVDLVRNRSVLVRDRIGKKPLFYSELSNGQLAFGSELKTLHVVPGFENGLDLSSVQDYFVFGYVPGARSIYDRVAKLAPAHMMVIENEEISVSCYASITFGPKWTDGEDSLRERMLEEIEEAVKVRLVSDVPFGAFLSGGLDSSVVCALMARNLGSKLNTFTIGFNEREFDEMPDARAIANHLGAEHHELVVEPNAVELIEQLSWYYDEPFGDSSAIPTYLVSKMAAEHVKMVLSGDGGDELFAGYSRYRDYNRLQAINRGSFGTAGSLLSAGSRFMDTRRGSRIRRIADRLNQEYPDNYLSGVALSTRGDMAQLFGSAVAAKDPYQAVREHYCRNDIDEPMERVLYGDMRSYLVDDILVKVDRASMANSLEARAPLLDQQLIDFVARMPFDSKYRAGQGKYVFRQIARQLLPASVLDKPKKGFAIPLDQWFRGELRPMVQDVFSSRSFRERGLFEMDSIRTTVDQHMAGTHQWGERLWLLLSFELWAQRFGYADSPAEVREVAIR